mmetsp:Transcript_35291/g.58081  ORF Transcript_35291/g.58081 Transcript_35291/m.58081 type:complete len:182 (+) Transcript_35291:53-598(+)
MDEDKSFHSLCLEWDKLHHTYVKALSDFASSKNAVVKHLEGDTSGTLENEKIQDRTNMFPKGPGFSTGKDPWTEPESALANIHRVLRLLNSKLGKMYELTAALKNANFQSSERNDKALHLDLIVESYENEYQTMEAIGGDLSYETPNDTLVTYQIILETRPYKITISDDEENQQKSLHRLF